MTDRAPKRSFAARPADPESWVKAAEAPFSRASESGGFTARLTIDVTPALRGRIKIAAFQKGFTVADMLRDLLARQFSEEPGDAS